jgi:hypothetical protein
MGNLEKLRLQIVLGTSEADIPFEAMCSVLRWPGFNERISGSHRVFTRPGVDEILNLQARGAQAKAYQVKQVRRIILKYNLGGEREA